MVSEYVSYSIYGSSLIIIVPTFVFIMRVDGMPKFSSAILIVSNAVNLIMDIVYIRVFDMGIKGAALATVTGYAVGSLMVLYYLCIYKKRTLRFIKLGASELKNIAELCTSAISSVLNTLLLFIKAIMLNRIVINAGGADAISAFSVCNFLLTFISMFVSGGADTMTPIVSMLSGEKDNKGIGIILKKTFAFVLCCCAAIIAIICLFPQAILAIFSVKSESKLAIGVPAVRIFSLSLIGMGISYIMMNYFQSVKHKALSVMITLLRGIVLTVPLAYAMSKLFGVMGIWWSIVVSEMLTAAAAFAVSFMILRTKKDKYISVFLFERSADNSAVLDVSLEAKKADAVSVSESICTFCLENSVDEQKAKYAGLLAEEMVEHIRRFNTEKVPQIDLFCKVLDDRVILSVRDNGAIFDPSNVDEDTQEFSNLKMIDSVADKVEYTRVIGLNNMLVELGR
jgi:Na+-driven multidrug efflux pump